MVQEVSQSPTSERRVQRWRPRAVAAVAALLLATASLASGLGAAALPGSPGLPKAPGPTIYFEDFQNQTATNGIRLPQYTGGAGANTSTYVASPNWLPAADQCNGWLLRSSTPRNTVVTNVDQGCDAVAWSFLQGMATAIGLYRGEALATAQQNQILSAYTNGGAAPGPGVQLQTAKPITAGIVPGHFYQISAIYGAANCVSEGPTLGRVDPNLTFNLILNQTGSGPAPGTGGGTLSTLATGLNPCTDPAARVISTGGHTYHVAQLDSAGFRMPAGVTALGVQLYNAAGGFRGNDSGFDDPRIVDVTPQLDKIFSPSTLPAGQSTTLTFTISNTDDLAAKAGWSFTDTLPAGLTFAGAAATDCPAGVATIGGNAITGTGNLDDGMVSCTFTVPVTSATTGTFTNGPGNIGPIDGLLEPGDSTVVFTTPDQPAISLVKTANLDPSAFVANAPVPYSFLVTNTGNVALTGVTVVDTAFSGTGAPPTISCPQTTLAVNANMVCTAQYVLTQGDVDAGSVTNTATATGTPPQGAPVTDTSTAVVSGSAAPALSLVKNADATQVTSPAAAGQLITFRYTLVNTGNVSLQNVSIADPLPGLGTITYAWPGADGVLSPQQVATATATYAVTQADVDAGQVANTADAAGETTTGTPVESEPSSTLTPLVPGAALDLQKGATPAFGTPAAPGDLITFDFTITNTGNLTLQDVNVVDLLPGLSTITYTWPGDAGVLAPGDIATATATYPITLADIDAGTVANTAIAHGTTPGGADTPSPEATTETPIPRAPALSLTKSANASGVSAPAAVGDPIVYTFSVTNTGNTTLTGVVITDQLAGLSALTYTWPGADGVLAPTQSATAVATYLVTQADITAGAVDNLAVASGLDPDDAPVESEPAATDTPLAANAAISLVKSVSPSDAASFVVGQTLIYSFVVTNTGNLPISTLSIADLSFSGSGPLPAATCPTGSLAPGAQATCTSSYVITQDDLDVGEITNTAEASGLAPDETPVTSNESSAVVPAAQTPSLLLAKSADTTEVTEAGQTVTYTYRLTNTGNVTLSAAAVTETVFTGAGTAPAPECPAEAATLLPGAFVDCTATYTTVEADLTGEPILNTATGSATTPTETTVTTPPSSAEVPTVVPTPTPTPTPTPPAPPAPDNGGALPTTGGTVPLGLLGAATAMLVAGLALVFVRRYLRIRRGR